MARFGRYLGSALLLAALLGGSAVAEDPGWDGLPSPGGDFLTGLSLGPDGEVWVAGGATLRRWTGGRWDLAAAVPERLPGPDGAPVEPGGLYEIHAAGGAVYASAFPGLVLRYEEGGWEWIGTLERSLSGDIPLHGWGSAALFVGSPYYSGFAGWGPEGGRSFRELEEVPVRPVDLHLPSAGRVLVLGFDLEVHEYRPDTGAWSVLPSARASGHLHALWGAPEGGLVMAVGDAGQVYCWRGAGAPERMETPGRADLTGVWGRSARDVYAVGRGGVLWHHDGNTWTAMESGTRADLAAVRGDDSAVYAVGAAGTVLRRAAPARP